MSTLENRYEAAVPETLDLAERAGLAVNALTGSVDPEPNYESYLYAHMDNRPSYFSHGAGGAVPAQTRSGLAHDARHDRQRAARRARPQDARKRPADDPGRRTPVADSGGSAGVRRRLAPGPGTVQYQPALYDHPAGLASLRRQCPLAGGGGPLSGRDGARCHAQGGPRLVFLCYSREGWRKDTSPSAQIVGDAHEPTVEEPERAAAYVNGQPLRACSRWYAETGESKWLDLAHSIALFMLKPTNWGTPEGPAMVAQPEQAMWNGHFHSHTYGMQGLLEYAIVYHDTRAAEFVAKFYEWGRHFGISRIGFFPAVIGSPQMLNRHHPPRPPAQPGRVCANGQ